MSIPSKKLTLKSNEYKLVEHLAHLEEGDVVVKTFRGHSEENCRRNALHTYDSLVLLKSSFSDVLLSPRALALDACAVTMEFLDELPGARQLSSDTLHLAAPFFHRCYKVDVDRDVYWSFEDSVHATPQILELLRSDFPAALGFKGDLYENLREANGTLILADSETASLEPLGLSELILYVYMIAGTFSRRELALRVPKYEIPVAFAYLSTEQRAALVSAALDYCFRRMQRMPTLLRRFKLNRSRRVLESFV